jgi:uncharacterized paraquat-inducible protein A
VVLSHPRVADDPCAVNYSGHRAICPECGLRFPTPERVLDRGGLVACPTCHVVAPATTEPNDEKAWQWASRGV